MPSWAMRQRYARVLLHNNCWCLSAAPQCDEVLDILSTTPWDSVVRVRCTWRALRALTLRNVADR